MEKLSVEKQTEVSKMSTERLRARLIKVGYDEDEVVEMDRNELLSTYAEYLLSPPIPESPEKAEGDMSAEELELRRRKEKRLQQELELKRQKDIQGLRWKVLEYTKSRVVDYNRKKREGNRKKKKIWIDRDSEMS